MYIRRKVFSLLRNERGEERYFSTTEYQLVDERMFAEAEEDSEDKEEKGKKKNLAKKIAVGAAVAPLAAYGAYKGGRALEKKIDSKKLEKLNKIAEKTDKQNKKIERLEKRLDENKADKFVGKVETPFKKAGKWVAEQWKGGEGGDHKVRNRVLMVGAPIAAGAATYGAVKGVKALKNRKNNKEENDEQK